MRFAAMLALSCLAAGPAAATSVTLAPLAEVQWIFLGRTDNRNPSSPSLDTRQGSRAALLFDLSDIDPAQLASEPALAGLRRRIRDELPGRWRSYRVGWDAGGQAVAGPKEFGDPVLEDLCRRFATSDIRPRVATHDLAADMMLTS